LILLSNKFRYTDENMRKFAVLYIVGNCIAITATAIFVGPQKLCHRMTAKTRRIGTVVWLLSMVAVFAAALLHAPMLAVLPLLVVESMAAVWYSASYLPFARKGIVKCCQHSLFSPCPSALKPVADRV
jgi:hypothetical protein